MNCDVCLLITKLNQTCIAASEGAYIHKSADSSCFALLGLISAAQSYRSVSLRNEVSPHDKAFLYTD